MRIVIDCEMSRQVENILSLLLLTVLASSLTRTHIYTSMHILRRDRSVCVVCAGVCVMCAILKWKTEEAKRIKQMDQE